MKIFSLVIFTGLIGVLSFANAVAMDEDDVSRSRSPPFYERVNKDEEFRYNPPQSIIGGDEIEPYSRPYLVSVGRGDDSYNGQYCGGSLISPHAVLTAAHCVTYFDYWLPPEWVEFNRHNLTDDTDAGVVRMTLKDRAQCDGDVIYHPDYDWMTFDNDVAILFLPDAVKDITPVTLNDDPKVPVSGAPLDVAGWGLTEYGYPYVPSAVSLNYITNEASTRKPYRWKDENIFDSMMCAAAPEKASCYGDSGGPLVMGNMEPEGGPLKPVIQVGVASRGRGCGDPRFPGVYTRVSKVANWVKDTVCERSGELCRHSKSSKNPKKIKDKNTSCIKVPTFAPSTPWPTNLPTITAWPSLSSYPPTFSSYPTWDWKWTNSPTSPWPTWVPTHAPISKADKA